MREVGLSHHGPDTGRGRHDDLEPLLGSVRGLVRASNTLPPQLLNPHGVPAGTDGRHQTVRQPGVAIARWWGRSLSVHIGLWRIQRPVPARAEIGEQVGLPSELLAVVPVFALGLLTFRLFRGERLLPVSAGLDYDRVAVEGGYGAELALAAFATARLADVPAARSLGFLFLALAAFVPVFASRVVCWSGHLFLGAIGGLAGLAALEGMMSGPCAAGAFGALLTVVSLLTAVVLFVLRLLLGGLLGWNLDLAAFLLGIFALAEFAPLAATGQDGAGTEPWWLRPALLALLLVVAIGVGLRPRFAAGMLAVAAALMSLGLRTTPGGCGIDLGWLAAAGVVIVTFRGIANAIASR